MRILLTGSNGQVGTEFRKTSGHDAEIISTGSRDLDLTREAEIRRFVREVKPDVIVNAAAFSDIDAAERNWDACFAINAIAPVILAEEAHRLDALLIHYSTDYVFDGTKSSPYTEKDPTSPLNVYGASKVAGEEGIAGSFARAIILRVGWIYSLEGDNFLRSVLRLAENAEELEAVSDQLGTPTSALAIAQATRQLIRIYETVPRIQFPTGIFHLAAQGSTSWHGFASAIVNALAERKEALVLPVEPVEHFAFARRPVKLALDCKKFHEAFGFQLAPWEDQLKEVLAEAQPFGSSPPRIKRVDSAETVSRLRVTKV
ncbi:dTDP-4-dehydrorhamnose reductase [Silvibacterium acidisoli]|uniref:dTDP-4-dehydrorhamnose reductase n=1 Tax=Acidobacteriaceae bacterium ZG23-2 TaxID=2883246 RepID=UPI00406C8EB7